MRPRVSPGSAAEIETLVEGLIKHPRGDGGAAAVGSAILFAVSEVPSATPWSTRPRSCRPPIDRRPVGHLHRPDPDGGEVLRSQPPGTALVRPRRIRQPLPVPDVLLPRHSADRGRPLGRAQGGGPDLFRHPRRKLVGRAAGDISGPRYRPGGGRNRLHLVRGIGERPAAGRRDSGGMGVKRESPDPAEFRGMSSALETQAPDSSAAPRGESADSRARPFVADAAERRRGRSPRDPDGACRRSRATAV